MTLPTSGQCCSSVLFVAGLALTTIACSSRSGYDDVPVPAGPLGISRVVSTVDQVIPGQRRVPVSLRLRNHTTEPIALLVVQPRFFNAGLDVSVDYQTTADPDAPTLLPAAGEVTVQVWVDVHGDARAGQILIDGYVMARLETGEVVVTTDADATETWTVAGLPTLLVTTVEDLDSVGVALAGNDTSLREAIRKAVVSGGNRAIRFDPGICPPATPATIQIDPALGALPPITVPGVIVDGSDAGVIIAGNGLNDTVGLDVRADDVSLIGLTLREFNTGQRSYCVETTEVARTQFIDLTLVDCGFGGGGGIALSLDGGREHLISGCRIQSSDQDAINFQGTPSSVTIIDTEVDGASAHGILVRGSGHIIADSTITGAGEDCIAVRGNAAIGIIIRDNDIRDSGNDGGDTGVEVSDGATQVLVENNQFESNYWYGARVLSGATHVTVRGNTFRDHFGGHFVISEGTNDDVESPIISGFDAVEVRGTATVAGTLEVYGYDDAWLPLGTLDVIAGSWTFDLPAPQRRVSALLTNAAGSTSGFAAPMPTGGLGLVVTSAADELDGGVGILDVAEAGPALSLREAMTLANNLEGADRITFDPAIFPAGTETVIYLGTGPANPEPLPALSDGGTVLDGTGSNVVIDGGFLPAVAGTGLIHVNGSRIEILSLTIRNADGPCLWSGQGGHTGFRAVGNTLTNCGGGSQQAGIYHYWGTAVEITDNVITNASPGIYSRLSSGGVVARNLVNRSDGHGFVIEFGSDSLVIIDNRFVDCAGDGIRMVQGASDDLIVGNQILRAGGAGIRLGDLAQSFEVVFNTIVGANNGIVLGALTGLRLQNNLVAGNTAFGLVIAVDADLTANHNLWFDNGGDGATGTNAIDGGSVDPTDLLSDPLLVDPPSGDLTPQAAAIDAGLDIGQDRNGSVGGLFNGSAPDIGAIETL